MTHRLHLRPEEYQSLFADIEQAYPFDNDLSHNLSLINCYADSSRSYHDLRHIDNLLKMMSAYLKDTGQDDRAAWNLKDCLIKAIWIHDIVQDDSGESEARSYELAHQQLSGLWPESALKKLEEVVRPLVLATAHFTQSPIMSQAEQTMADIDLTPLGVSEEEFDANSAKVRAEFMHVPIFVYAGSRANILQLFLQRDRIYYLDWFYERYEMQARENLKREIQNLLEAAE